MAEPELFVICNNCGSEVSPYVTECPYCGHRLRKRAPDLKKQRREDRRREKKQERDQSKQIAAVKAKLGVGRTGAPALAYLDSHRKPFATGALVLLAVAVSIALRANGAAPFLVRNFIFTGDIPGHWWQLLTAPFFHFGYGFAFVVLAAAALFGAGLERRFGPAPVIVTWLLCGAAGVAMQNLIEPDPTSWGAVAPAVGLLTAWLTVVVTREDLRDYDHYGIVAISAVLMALPLATDEASVWTIIGGVVTGAVCGAALTRLPQR